MKMEDSLKKFLEEGERLKKFTDSFDLGKKLASLGLSDSIGIQASNMHSMKNFALPTVRIPEPIQPPKFQTLEENNNFQSAGALLKRLAESIAKWRQQLPDDVQPAIVAILHGGIQIDVESLAQESFHGIRIEGKTQGSPCVVLAHQATVQLLCFVQPIKPPEQPRRRIGFVIDGQESQV
jgi:hypothetical protein